MGYDIERTRELLTELSFACQDAERAGDADAVAAGRSDNHRPEGEIVFSAHKQGRFAKLTMGEDVLQLPGVAPLT